jgi:mannitol-1-phosphate 5-dehydrogenase
VAQFLHQAGYEVVFVDVVGPLIDTLKESSSYKVIEVSDVGSQTTTVTNYRAINSQTNEADVVSEIATAEIVTCAVGPKILKFIAPVIAKGIDARTEAKPVAVIACENAIMATDTLYGFVEAQTDPARVATMSSRAIFANSAVDRIVPNQTPQPGANLDVKIESFWEWCVELPPFKGVGEPKISAIHYVENLKPYIERKLFTVNTGHATTAYFGKLSGKEYIHEAINDKTIHDKVRAVLGETASLIVAKHEIPQNEQEDYVNKIMHRFSNPALADSVIRVGRAPMRQVLFVFAE